MSTVIIKRGGKRPSEEFSSNKLQNSVSAACLSVRSQEGLADDVAARVCQAVSMWCQEKPEVTSNDIRRVAGQHLEKYHPEAAYLYTQNGITI
ncbi:MAG: hypothetical protein L0H38_03135 [bacterium]|nr:hypothetical protein [bacterium]